MKSITSIFFFFFTFLSLLSCKKDSPQQLKKLEDLFSYSKYSVDTTIRLVDTARNRTLVNRAPFVANDNFNGYGFPTVLVLDKDHLLMAVSRYVKLTDWGTADIVAKESFDNGQTWTDEVVIQKNIGNIQTAAPSLLRINDTTIGLFFSVKNSASSCDVYFKVSGDNGRQWGEPRKINTMEGYNTMNNDRVIKAGTRIIIPVGYTTDVDHWSDKSGCFCYYSDDEGATWQRSKTISTTVPLMEPGVVRIGETNELLMVMRSVAGSIIISRSYDLGYSWTTPTLTGLQSPESPSTISQVKGTDKLVLAWNNNKFNFAYRYTNRFPLTVAFSSDKGKTWKNGYNIEWLSSIDYSYPAFFQNENKTYFFYNVSPHGSKRILTRLVEIE
ncbi:sialidase family protein [Chitinophaga sp. YIM B06452]|uniref:sialidase family protein n=1 Tax=Chitinophaga sp. YIM B06452 TaxID=3082158 RepID=UPI0031FF3FDE